MYSFNQQGFSSANFVSDSNFGGENVSQQRNFQPQPVGYRPPSNMNYQTQQCWQMQNNSNVGAVINNQTQQWMQPQANYNVGAVAFRQNWRNQPASHPSPRNGINQFQVPQVQYCQQPVISTASMQYPASLVQGVPARHHQARISLVPDATGGLKAIVKRKRKRTMFTTEQVELLESVFRSRPYVTREDRKALVDQLQINDTTIKVWFQNRRLRGKREAAEAELCDEYEVAEYQESLYDNTEAVTSDESMSGSPNAAQIDRIEEELKLNSDDSGDDAFITLDQKLIDDLAKVIDNVLPADVDLTQLSNNSSDEAKETPDDVLNDILDIASGDTVNVDNVAAFVEVANVEVANVEDSKYEAISPAAPEKTEEDDTLRWEPLPPEMSLQELFDRHFC